MTPSEVALEAARLIGERGLAKGFLFNEDGEVCHNGAIFLAATGSVTGRNLLDPEAEERYLLGIEVIGRSQIIMDRRGIPGRPSAFNDEPGTSQEDIQLLLKENAALDDEEVARFVRQKREKIAHSLAGLRLP